MLGYMYKDAALLKKQARLLLIIFAVYIVYSFSAGQVSLLAFSICIGNIGTMLAVFSYEERAGFYKYNCILPISRKKQVLCRYLEIVIVTLGMFLLTLLVAVFIKTEEDLAQKFLQLALTSCLGLIYIAVLMPVIYKFGVEKTRILFLLVLVIPVAAGYFIFRMTGIEWIAKIAASNIIVFIGNHLPVFVLLATLLCLGVSYWISVRMESKKEYY